MGDEITGENEEESFEEKIGLYTQILIGFQSVLNKNSQFRLDGSEFVLKYKKIFREMTEQSKFVVDLIMWKDVSESRKILEAKRKRDLLSKSSTSAKERIKVKITTNGPPTPSNSYPTLAGRFRLAARDQDPNGNTTMRDTIISTARVEELDKIPESTNISRLAFLKQDKELKDVVLNTTTSFMDTFIEHFPVLKGYWESPTLSRLATRKKCSIFTAVFLVLMNNCLVASEFVTNLEGVVKNTLLRNSTDKNDDLFVTEPIHLVRMLVGFILRDCDYSKKEHKALVLKCFIFICRKWMLTGSGTPGFSEITTYKPLSHLMHLMFHSFRRFNAFQIMDIGVSLPQDFPLKQENSRGPYFTSSPLCQGIMKYIKGIDFRSDRTQLFNDTIFSMFMGPGEEITLRDVSPFDTVTSILAMDEVSFSPFRDMCSLIVYLGAQKILARGMEQGEVAGEGLTKLFSPEETTSVVTQKEISLVLTHACVFALDLMITTLTSGEKTDFIETNVFYEPSMKTFDPDPGDIIFMGNRYLVADIGKEMIDTHNKPDILFAAYKHSLRYEAESVSEKARIFRFFSKFS